MFQPTLSCSARKEVSFQVSSQIKEVYQMTLSEAPENYLHKISAGTSRSARDQQDFSSFAWSRGLEGKLGPNCYGLARQLRSNCSQAHCHHQRAWPGISAETLLWNPRNKAGYHYMFDMLWIMVAHSTDKSEGLSFNMLQLNPHHLFSVPTANWQEGSTVVVRWLKAVCGSIVAGTSLKNPSVTQCLLIMFTKTYWWSQGNLKWSVKRCWKWSCAFEAWSKWNLWEFSVSPRQRQVIFVAFVTFQTVLKHLTACARELHGPQALEHCQWTACWKPSPSRAVQTKSADASLAFSLIPLGVEYREIFTRQNLVDMQTPKLEHCRWKKNTDFLPCWVAFKIWPTKALCRGSCDRNKPWQTKQLQILVTKMMRNDHSWDCNLRNQKFDQNARNDTTSSHCPIQNCTWSSSHRPRFRCRPKCVLSK